MEHINEVLAHAVANYGDRTAIDFNGNRISFNQLLVSADEAAKACVAHGIGHGDRICIWAPNSVEWIVAAVGAQSIGAVLVPINTRLGGEEASDIIERSGSKLLFTAVKLEQGAPLDLLCAPPKTVVFDGSDARALDWRGFVSRGQDVADEVLLARKAATSGEDMADMLFTSGTTGKPKGVLCNHRQNAKVFTVWAATVGLNADDKYLIVNPFFHSFGYKAGWFACLLVGCTMFPVAAFNKTVVLQKIQDDRITMLPGAPSLYEMLLADPDREHYDLSSLRLGVTGAASIPVQLVRDMKSILGFDTVVTAYGLTESTGVATICRPEDDAEIIASTSGRAMDGVDVICANPDTGEEVPRGNEGEIWVRGYNVMQSYFDQPEATASTITPEGWLRTGDIGVMDEQGYLKITDRLKDMYIMNGENVYPAEVEKTIYAIEGVAQAAVIGVPKAPQGEVGMAFVVPKPNSSVDKDSIIDACRRQLASYKVPYFVEFVDALPMNASGKVVKPELKKLANSLLPN